MADQPGSSLGPDCGAGQAVRRQHGRAGAAEDAVGGVHAAARRDAGQHHRLRVGGHRHVNATGCECVSSADWTSVTVRYLVQEYFLQQ